MPRLSSRPPDRNWLRHAGPIVVLAPHPDDETLGCGLLIADAVRLRVPLAVVVLTDGQASHPGSRRWPPPALARLRRSETRRALARLGAGDATLRFMGWRDGRLGEDARPLRLRRLLHVIGARTVLVSSPLDSHPDHQAAWRLARSATRGSAANLLSYAVWSRLDEAAAPRVRHMGLPRKRWAMQAHRSQTSDYINDAPGGFFYDRSALDRLVTGAERFAYA
ncbi:PIG-L deacetylase family protein [uncultured Sphingomonas sp.]|uniref:PIG-L deacetylase family protein n=1 Tax=uncultured Sphingomonas sp. TaxID=158754 RepID=UPI0035C9F45E